MASNNSPAVAASPSAPTSTPGAHSRHTTDIPSTSDSDTLIIDPDVNESTHDINALQHSGAPHIPWWKRPSPWWIMCAVPISATAMSATLAPRVTIYTQLVCQDLAASSHHQGDGSTYNPTHLFFSLLSATGAYADVHGYSKFSAISDDCASDPEVLSTVAKLIAVMTTSLGVLGCLTTAWWGLFSDRRGRTTVLGISVFGLLFNDIVFIVVSMLSSGIRRGYWALIIGPIVEGLLGGSISLSAAVNAYVADTTTQENRSRFFSLALGLLFTGMTFGPAIGSLLISASSSVLSVFYLAAAAHALFGIFVWFILPESLSKEAMLASHETHITSSSPVQHRRGGLGTTLIRLFSFLSPLSVFAPPASPNPLKRTRRDWSLSLLAISYGFSLLIMGSYQYKFQYASDLFKWDSETLGYWLSIVLGARALYLMVILPVLIKWLKPPPLRQCLLSISLR